VNLYACSMTQHIKKIRHYGWCTLISFILLPMSVATAESTPAPDRIEELEAQVRELLKQQTQQQSRIENLETTSTSKATSEPVPATKPAPVSSIQSSTLLPAATPGTTLRFGGFVKVDFLASQTGHGQLTDGDIGRATYLPATTPVGGKSSGVDYDAHAKFSRLNLGVDHVSGAQRIGAYVEVDFFGNLLGNQVTVNSYGLALRHVYLYWNDWLVGQTWSNFMDLSAYPETVDFIGPTDGVLLNRQAQLRYRRGGFSIALENPETTLTGQASSDRGAWPDLTVRYGWSGSWGTFGVAGLVRKLEVHTSDYSDSRVGWGLTLGGRLQLRASDILYYQLSGGVGMSRYVGIGINGDASLDPDTGNLHLTSLIAGYVGWRHNFTDSLRGHVIYARSDYDNDRRFSGPNATSHVYSMRVNLIYSPVPKLDLGAEVIYARREVESGDEGDLKRVQCTAKYTF